MLKIEKFTDVCMTGGMMHTPSHTRRFRAPQSKEVQSHKFKMAQYYANKGFLSFFLLFALDNHSRQI